MQAKVRCIGRNSNCPFGTLYRLTGARVEITKASTIRETRFIVVKTFTLMSGRIPDVVKDPSWVAALEQDMAGSLCVFAPSAARLGRQHLIPRDSENSMASHKVLIRGRGMKRAALRNRRLGGRDEFEMDEYVLEQEVASREFAQSNLGRLDVEVGDEGHG